MKHSLILLLLCSVSFAQTKPATSKSGTATGAATKGATAKTPAQAPAKAAPAKAAANLLNPKSLNAKAPDVFMARLETTKGNMTVRVERALSPNGVDRFYNLVRAGFYDNTYFFRCLDFMAQIGISSRPDVSRAWANAEIPDDHVKETNRRGTISMATSGPNSRTTQFFINRINNARLDPLGFSPLGEVIEGLEVIDAIYSGYGDDPDQSQLTTQGEAYLNRYFPRLDKIVKATILPR